MNAVEAFGPLEQDFDRIIRGLDLGLIIEHIRRLDRMAFARHFQGYRPQTLGRRRVTESLRFELYERHNDTVAEVLVLLWNQFHRDLYQAMLALVRTIHPKVEEIERIPDDKANDFIDELLLSFDRRDIHACVRLNDVRFSPEVIQARLAGPSGAAPVPAEPPAEAVLEAGDPVPAPGGESLPEGEGRNSGNPGPA
ncbi:MAG TPA: hypothetical protein PLQ97_08645 [Myxococcota bacterium]|nr:hypothetical protein [Myxococcota bacterium]HQK51385.1 hypothetical protein [Myxococcota bacterium]